MPFPSPLATPGQPGAGRLKTLPTPALQGGAHPEHRTAPAAAPVPVTCHGQRAGAKATRAPHPPAGPSPPGTGSRGKWGSLTNWGTVLKGGVSCS